MAFQFWRRQKPRKRDNTTTALWAVSEDIRQVGYTPLSSSPEVVTACRKIADVISSMTIYLMANTDNGDIRIQNELSRKIDISPSRYMTRKTWMESIVMTMLLYGNGNAVVRPHTHNGILTDLELIPAGQFQFHPELDGYSISICGVRYDPDDLLHFVYSPDRNYPWKGRGMRAPLRDIVKNLAQARETTNAFMSSKWKPSVIVKVDALTDEFSSKEGRSKLLDEYIETAEAGEPWLIPAEAFSVEQVRPLSLSDLAINDAVELDRRMVASILGVPPFVLGVGEYSESAWNAFVSNTVQPIARGIEQELTRKLILSDRMYLRFNIQSLMDYDLKTIASVYGDLSDRGFVTGNEVRDRIGMSPRAELDELRVLENYIPAYMTGMQKKLKDGDT